MSDIGFRVQGSKAYVIRGENEKEIPRDAVLEIYQLVLGHISPNRDYSSVTSVRKLLRIVDLECEPDESEDEDESEEEEEAPKPARGRRPAAKAPARRAPAKKAESDDESDDDDEDSD